jgi:DNA invertase Pin-like site-specific DNA recombinase
MRCRLVAYKRVSTSKQGESGLGLEGQDAAIQAHVQATGCNLIASYVEVETGKRDDLENRPQLLAAIAHAKRSRATLVIAKLDRLSRSVWVTAELQRTGVRFVACDNPAANELTINILAAVAQDEAKRISERTKAALAAYKAQGRVAKKYRDAFGDNLPPKILARSGKLGASLPECRNLTDEARQRGWEAAAEAKRNATRDAYADLVPLIIGWRREGVSQAEIASKLNDHGHTTTSGSPWTQAQVSRIITRAKQDQS